MEELSKVEIKEYNHVQFDKIEFPDKEVGTGNQNIPNQQNQQGTRISRSTRISRTTMISNTTMI